MDEIKLFDRWQTETVKVNDEGLVSYINLDPVIVPRSGGRHAKHQFYKSKVNIVERLINRLFVAGHKGRKHKFTSGQNVGKTFGASKIVVDAFGIIEEKTKANPVEVLVRAIENSAPIEEVTTFRKGGMTSREGVVTSPQRRVDLALRHIAQGTYASSVKSRKSAASCLADEILLAYKGDMKSRAVSEKQRREKESQGAR
ncbi:MAG: 30S ribosomal protein S7 [Candidatus Aenigmarchaeota archaeon]|nr:30S ribosomal protein S7 [Candidatus Aenigmarchaeota archaeon]